MPRHRFMGKVPEPLPDNAISLSEKSRWGSSRERGRQDHCCAERRGRWVKTQEKFNLIGVEYTTVLCVCMFMCVFWRCCVPVFIYLKLGSDLIRSHIFELLWPFWTYAQYYVAKVHVRLIFKLKWPIWAHAAWLCLVWGLGWSILQVLWWKRRVYTRKMNLRCEHKPARSLKKKKGLCFTNKPIKSGSTWDIHGPVHLEALCVGQRLASLVISRA